MRLPWLEVGLLVGMDVTPEDMRRVWRTSKRSFACGVCSQFVIMPVPREHGRQNEAREGMEKRWTEANARQLYAFVLAVGFQGDLTADAFHSYTVPGFCQAPHEPTCYERSS